MLQGWRFITLRGSPSLMEKILDGLNQGSLSRQNSHWLHPKEMDWWCPGKIHHYAMSDTLMGFSCGSAVKTPSAVQEVQETQIQCLGREDPLEEARRPTPELWPGKSHGQRRLGVWSMRSQRVGHDWTPMRDILTAIELISSSVVYNDALLY